MKNKARLVLVDDHSVVRESLARVLSQEPDFEVVGSWSSAEEALEQLEPDGFDVVILDFGLPGMDGISATRKMKDLSPAAKVLILSMHVQESSVLEAFEAGVVAYMPKEVSVGELCTAIRTVLRGESLLSPRITRQLLEYCQRMKDGDGQVSLLTPVQIQILKLAGCGYANKEIAVRTGLGADTVKLRMKEIFGRLGVQDRTHAVIKALKMGLFCLEDTADV